MPQPIIKRNRVLTNPSECRSGSSAVRVLQDQSPAPCPGEKAVRLLDEDGRARAIEFTCSCGEVTVVELLYSSDGTEEMP